MKSRPGVLVAAASVACQAAGRGELAILEDRGHRVASRQQRELNSGKMGWSNCAEKFLGATSKPQQFFKFGSC